MKILNKQPVPESSEAGALNTNILVFINYASFPVKFRSL